MEFPGWTNDDLRRFILDREEQVEQIKDSIDMAREALSANLATEREKRLKNSAPYLDETLGFLEARGYTIGHDALFNELDGATYWAIFPPRKGDEFVFFNRYFGQREDALLQAAVDLLGDLSEWLPRQANRA